MIRKIVLYTTCLIIATICVLVAVNMLGPLMMTLPRYVQYLIFLGIGLVVAVLSFFMVRPIGRMLERLAEKTTARIQQLSMAEIISIAVGLILGLVIAALVGTTLSRIEVIGPYLSILCMLVCGYLGGYIGYRQGEDFFHRMTNRRSERREEFAEEVKRLSRSERKERKERKKDRSLAAPKVLDTSVIIDGRIADIYRSGFLEGELVVSHAVLAELRHIADSSDTLKRNRGRGGLDCLQQMQDEFDGAVVIDERDYADVAEVDLKLLRLAEDLQGVVVTNDYNLNKVAQLQGIRVLNVNELANAVKPIALPGEEMTVLVVKEGKEINQGVAYLDDGTMIVVENGRSSIGKRVPVVVTSTLQTAAGRMVFARLKADA